jgi:hypothetical protein
MTVDDEIIRAMMMFMGHPPDTDYRMKIVYPGNKPTGPGEKVVITSAQRRTEDPKG